VILFDEVEKAHPDVFNVLLQVGSMTSRPPTARAARWIFTNTVLISPATSGSASFWILAGDPARMRDGRSE